MALAINGLSSNNGDCHDDSTALSPSIPAMEWVGAACGHHGPYTFYKAVKLSTTRMQQRRILALGDFFFVKMWPDQDIVAIAELQLLWEGDKLYQQPSGNSSSSSSSNNNNMNGQHSSSPLASLKLYFLPENTPDGRHEEHGEDEVVSIAEKVVLKVSDLATWLVDDVKWDKGAPSVWERQCASPPPAATDACTDVGSASPDLAATAESSTNPAADLPPAGASIGVLDMRDVIKEKQAIGDATSGSSNIMVLSYPAYCRYRSTLKRLEGHKQTEFMRQAVVEAIGGRAAPSPNTRIVFCKCTFDYPELEDHELLCNHLAPKWKGRPRKMRKKRSHSPGSESNESESSVSTVTSSYRSKNSPMKHGIRNVPTPYRAGDRPKGEQMFLQKLHKFMAGRGTPIGRLPSLGFKQLDLFSFFTKVQRAGGYESAVANKQWKGIYIELGGHPSNTSAATCTRRHYEKLLLPYERQAFSMAEESAPGASGHSPAAAMTPPKKRKLSSNADDLPFEVPAEMKERLRAVAEASNLTLQELMAVGDPSSFLAAAGDSKQLQFPALGDLARIAQQLDAKRPKPDQPSKVCEVRPSVIQKSSVADTKQAKDKIPPPAHSQKPVTLPNIPTSGSAPASEQLRQWYAHMLSDKPAGAVPDNAAAMLELTLRPPTPAAATPSIFVPTSRHYTDPTLDIRKSNNRNLGNPPPAHSKPVKASVAAPPTAPKPVQIQARAAPAPPRGIPLVDLTSRSAVKQEVVNGKPLLDLTKLPAKHWSGGSASRDVSISLNVKIEGSEGKAGGSVQHQRPSVTVMPLVKEEAYRHRKDKEVVRNDRVTVTPQQPQQQSYPRMVDSLMSMHASSAPSSVPQSKSTYSTAQYKPQTSSASSSGMHPYQAAMLDPALASYYSSLYSPHNMYNLQAGAFMAAAAAQQQQQQQHPGNSMFHQHHHHQQMVASSAAAEVTAQVYKDLVQRGYPPALAPGLPPGLSGLPGLGSLGSFAASMYSMQGKDGAPSERSLPKS